MVAHRKVRDVPERTYRDPNKVDRGGERYHKPDDKSRRVVIEAVGLGMQQKNVARMLGICVRTLRKHYREELDIAVDSINFDVARALYQRASSGKDTIASIFMLKSRAGWKDTQAPDANLPSQIQVTFALPDSKEAVGQQTAMVDVTPKETRETEEEPEPN